MMYGFGLPILFPITCLAFGVMYVHQKICMYYWYRLPRTYSKDLNEFVLLNLAISPVFYLIFGYWMASNKQLLSNDHLTPVTY